jgi:hypothetical protein
MKKVSLTFLVLFCILFNNNSYSQNSGTGLGIILGEPTGVSLKHWINSKNAIDGAIAWSFLDNGAFHIHADYLFHMDAFNNPKVPFYVGIGGRIKLKNNNDASDNKIGARVPVGFDVHFPEPSLGIFVEVVPILDIAPGIDVSFNAAIGLRYFFK